ncbi:F-box only protein 8-like [Styela clava]
MGQLSSRETHGVGSSFPSPSRSGLNNGGQNGTSHLYRPGYLWQIFKHRRARNFRNSSKGCRLDVLEKFPDLYLLPPEIGIEVLKNLNATDLCLAACVWSDLANDEMLWEGLCKNSWAYCTAYKSWKDEGKSFKKLYLLLDEGSLTFNAEPLWGMKYLFENHILDDNASEIAMFFHGTNQLVWQKVRQYLNTRNDVLDELLKLQSFKNQFLPNALRKFFQAVDAPISRGEYLNLLIDKFAVRFCNDNPDIALVPEIVAILCYSLILLSVDLTSPQVKNKMSKREFVRNVRSAVVEYSRQHAQGNIQLQNRRGMPQENIGPIQAIAAVDSDFAGHLYDNIYLVGHIAPQRWKDDQG